MESKMKSKSLITTCLALAVIAAFATHDFAGVRAAKNIRGAVAHVAFDNNQLAIEGSGLRVTRQGVGRYTVTYDKAFAATPRLAAERLQDSIEFTNSGFIVVDGNYKKDRVGCIVTNQTTTGATITCAGADPASEVCYEIPDGQGGDPIVICNYTALTYSDIPFNIAAFGE